MTGTSLRVKPLDVAEAVKHGTLMRKVATAAPLVFSAWIVAHVLRVVDRLEAKTTVRGEDEAKEIAREIYRNFPTLRIEEMEEVFNGMIFGRYGKYYERLKAAEFIDAFKQHEASEQRIAAFEQRHKRQAYAIAVYSPAEFEQALKECLKRGYSLRKDNTTKGATVDVMYIVIEGLLFDYEASTNLDVMSVEKFTAPVNYTKAGERIEARVMTNGERLRKALQVDNKVMADYILNKPSNTMTNENS